MVTQARTLLDNAILQSVAESYLHLWDENDYKAILLAGEEFHPLDEILSDGVNHPDLNPNGEGATRLTSTQIDWLIKNYDIAYHYPNDASGFSATLFKNKTTGEYTLSFRSTEFQFQTQGGDYERDGTLGADGDISGKGYALAQLSAMETFYAKLKAGQVYNPATQAWEASTDPDLLAFVGQTVPLSVTGYSLGGHLATAFTLMHPEVAQTYTFNAAGVGGIGGDTVPTGAGIQGLITLYDQMMAWDGQGTPTWWVDMQGYASSTELVAFKAAALSYPGVFTGSNVYASAKNRAAMDVLAHSMYPSGAGNEILSLDGIGDWQLKNAIRNWLYSSGTGPFGLNPNAFNSTLGKYSVAVWSRIQQIYGHGEFFDPQMVANSGYHAPADPIWTEDLPASRGLGILEMINSQTVRDLVGDFGETHSISLLTDSLTVLDLLQGLDSSIDNARFAKIMKTMSNRVDEIDNTLIQAAVTAGLATLSSLLVGIPLTTLATYLNDDRLYDGDAMENFVNALTLIFTGNPGTLTQKRLADGTADPLAYADITERNKLHDAIKAIGGSPLYQQSAGQVSIKALASLNATQIAELARTDMGVRYALAELSPFAIVGNDALYAPFNTDGSLDYFDPQTGTGTLTDAYLRDRAAMLAWKIQYDYGNRDIDDLLLELGDKQYDADWDTNLQGNWDFVDLGKPLPNGDPLTLAIDGTGTSLYDHQIVFGTKTGETLTGSGVEDRLYGNAGNDTLIGNAGSDSLDGGRGDDILNGGTGQDIYRWRTGDGNDTIIDSPGGFPHRQIRHPPRGLPGGFVHSLR